MSVKDVVPRGEAIEQLARRDLDQADRGSRGWCALPTSPAPEGRTARPIGRAKPAAPRIAEVDPLADDLVVAELHDADDHHRFLVVSTPASSA
jgi:hypothetical protein